MLPLPLNRIKYVMTDFTENNFKHWKEHPALKEYVESGIIDFTIFDATSDSEMTLYHSKVTLKPNSVKNPIVVVANYLFDTLHHDLFQVIF